MRQYNENNSYLERFPPMPAVSSAPRRLVIPQHARQGQNLTGATWSDVHETVRIGVVDRHVEQDLVLPSTQVAPHLSLVLLLEGKGHFLMGGRSRPCEFVDAHCFLSCGFEPFDGEDFIPAHARFRAVLMHYPLPLRRVFGDAVPVAPAGCEVHAHPHARAWLARLPMDEAQRAFARTLCERGVPEDPLSLLELECQALQSLHGVARRLTMTPQAAPATDEPGTAGHALTGRDRRRLLLARRHIDSHLAQPLRLAEVARVAGLSETALKQGFRGLFGSSVYAHVLRARCELAERLLRDGALSVQEVALRSGFGSASHLAAQFKRQFGTTPLQYRRRQA
jgi:AraC-like DNA-binding protein